MNATFSALAFTAALNPKLLALHPAADREPAAAGDVPLPCSTAWPSASLPASSTPVFHLDALNSQRTIGAGADPALGLLLAAGALAATGRWHRPHQPGWQNKDRWVQRILAEPWLGRAMLIVRWAASQAPPTSARCTS